jgi:uncharacterized membrane protein
MPAPRRDQQLEQLVGKILRIGVVISTLITLMGGALYLAGHGGSRVDYRVFRGEPLSLRRVSDIAVDAAALHPRGIMQLGLVLLLATPLMRVFLSACSFALQKDVLYMVVTLMVFSVLLFSLLGPHLPHP